MVETKIVAKPVVEDSYPEPDNRTERERELEALMDQREGQKLFVQVPWAAGVLINGIEYKGLVKVDAVTAAEIHRLCNHRARSEILGLYGDGNPGLHTVTGTHNIFGF